MHAVMGKPHPQGFRGSFLEERASLLKAMAKRVRREERNIFQQKKLHRQKSRGEEACLSGNYKPE